jgi:excisionase family DNA binding protein
MAALQSRPKPLLSVGAVADRLDLSQKTIRRWIERGELPAHHLGRAIRISEEDLALYLHKQRKGRL